MHKQPLTLFLLHWTPGIMLKRGGSCCMTSATHFLFDGDCRKSHACMVTGLRLVVQQHLCPTVKVARCAFGIQLPNLDIIYCTSISRLGKKTSSTVRNNTHHRHLMQGHRHPAGRSPEDQIPSQSCGLRHTNPDRLQSRWANTHIIQESATTDTV